MVHIASFNDLKSCSFGFIDEVWVIVRSLKNALPTFWNEDSTVRTDLDVYHVPQLSPSVDLFHSYLRWRDEGIWNEETFQEKYVPQFLNEMHGEEQKRFLNILFQKAQQKEILLLCFCPDETLCHRSIVLGLIQGVCKEREIEYEENNDYSDYYVQYRKLNNPFIRNSQRYKYRQENYFYLLVAGTRTYNDYETLKRECDMVLSKKQNYHIVIVEGGAKGADALAKRYANERGYELKEFPADWNKYGKSAGYRRNEQMHNYIMLMSDSPKGRGCLCFWNGESKGTAHNFKLSKDEGTPLWVYNYEAGFYINDEALDL